MRFGDVLDYDGDVEVPCSDRFVVGRRDETAVLVDEGDGVYRPEMLIVLLRDFAGVKIVLQASMIISKLA